VDCGGSAAPICGDGKKCLADTDCAVACSYNKTCIAVRSCKPHLGGDTCGLGEVGQAGAAHESCCRTLPVQGFVDVLNPGKSVYLDKYEITAGRMRAFIADIAAKAAGQSDIRGWVQRNRPPVWDTSWNAFLPSALENETVTVDRRLLVDRRREEVPEGTPGEAVRVGVDYQFNGQLFVYLHGNNCSTHEGSYGFPTFFYPADVLAKTGALVYPPRADGLLAGGVSLPAREHLDAKSVNCVSNALLAAFCHWDGGQLATDSVLDFVTDSPAALGNAPGCGSQVGNEYPPASDAAMKGGRCADLAQINATFDAGSLLPMPGSPLNKQNYRFPLFSEAITHDKAWQVSAPGRGSFAASGAQVDVVRLRPDVATDEPWVDLAGNLGEAVLTMSGGQFTGKFGLKFRGVGYQSARSELNFRSDWPGEGGMRRIERAEARAAFTGGRCMRFK
jgi:hypothetical protein